MVDYASSVIKFTTVYSDRMEFDHDIDGRQEVIRDRKGYSTVYLYDDNGNILKTTDALGNVTENTYDALSGIKCEPIAKGGSGLGNKRIYRVMSEAELDAVKDTGMLRGGREGTTFFTDSYYKNASTAKYRLSLPEKPKYIMEFEIENKTKILGGTRVEPNFGELGGGREYFTNDLVKVKIINYQKMIGGN